LLDGVSDKWNLVDWPAGLRDGYDFELPATGVKRGKHNVINAFWYGMLRDMDEIRTLLGEKNAVRLAIASVLIALVLYIVFSGMLSVNLPRGTIGFLRNFALFLESIVAGVKGIFG